MFVCEKAHAKINLVLYVTGKRADGYHELQTVFQSLALHDTLIFRETRANEITLTSDDPSLPVGPDNLVWRAAERLKLFYQIRRGAHITIRKRIPVAAGLAGGSSDAAATLRGLTRLWELPYNPAVLLEIAAALGSDVPFCLAGGTAAGCGRGEKLRQLQPLPQFTVVLANPGFAVSTADVFRALKQNELSETAEISGMIGAVDRQDRQEIIHHLANTLEMPTFRLYPAVHALKQKMNTGGNALMCGSGPSVFTLFASHEAAHLLYRQLQQMRMPTWLTSTLQPICHGGFNND